MMLRYLPSCVILVGLLFSCEKEEEQPYSNPTQIEAYFPLKRTVEEQISLLDQKEVKKWSLINGKEKEDQVKLDEEAWRKELDIFIHADINKASLATSYDTEKSEDRMVHRLKSGEKGAVKEIRVIYQEGTEKVKKVEFISERDNLFYSASSQGSLTFEGDILDTYKVEGYQKVWFLSPNKLDIQGEILP